MSKSIPLALIFYMSKNKESGLLSTCEIEPNENLPLMKYLCDFHQSGSYLSSEFSSDKKNVVTEKRKHIQHRVKAYMVHARLFWILVTPSNLNCPYSIKIIIRMPNWLPLL